MEYTLEEKLTAMRHGELVDLTLNMYEALKSLVHKFRVAGEILDFTEAHLLKELQDADKALAKANSI